MMIAALSNVLMLIWTHAWCSQSVQRDRSHDCILAIKRNADTPCCKQAATWPTPKVDRVAFSKQQQTHFPPHYPSREEAESQSSIHTFSNIKSAKSLQKAITPTAEGKRLNSSPGGCGKPWKAITPV